MRSLSHRAGLAELQRPCNLFTVDSLLLCDTVKGRGGAVNYINPKQINGWQPLKGCGKWLETELTFESLNLKLWWFLSWLRNWERRLNIRLELSSFPTNSPYSPHLSVIVHTLAFRGWKHASGQLLPHFTVIIKNRPNADLEVMEKLFFFFLVWNSTKPHLNSIFIICGQKCSEYLLFLSQNGSALTISIW